ncbi:hypothetical protein QR680_005372 [Steinernema hermaphroditum]|uniref:BZIP domain-containing protein n=1 Tax=Steinernema hermaphroditum TaxID=289476 RepID=A0AA39HRR7_9BILA|nr:hypothetical protein QR680_005372 [Steinernema hermaphroditum]
MSTCGDHVKKVTSFNFAPSAFSAPRHSRPRSSRSSSSTLTQLRTRLPPVQFPSASSSRLFFDSTDMSLFQRDYTFVDSLIATNGLEQLRDDIAARENLLSKAEIAIGLEAASAGRVGLSQDDDAPDCRSLITTEGAAVDAFFEAPLASAEQSVWQGQWPLADADSLFIEDLTPLATVVGDAESRVRCGTNCSYCRYRVNLSHGTPPGGPKCCVKRAYTPPPKSKRSSSSCAWNGAISSCCFMRGSTTSMSPGMSSRVHGAGLHHSTAIADGQHRDLCVAPRLLPPDSIVGKLVPEASYNFSSVFSGPNEQNQSPPSYPSSVSPNPPFSPPSYSFIPRQKPSPSPFFSYLPASSSNFPSPQHQDLLSDAKKRWLDAIIEETRVEIYSQRTLQSGSDARSPLQKRPFDASPDVQEVPSRKRSRPSSDLEEPAVATATQADLVVVGSRKYLLVPVEDESEDSGISDENDIRICDSPDANFVSSSSDSAESQVAPPQKAPTKRCHSLAGLSAEEVAERKKEQNRKAAARYRRKQRETFEADRNDLVYFEKRNRELRATALNLEREIRKYKEAIIREVAPSHPKLELLVS